MRLGILRDSIAEMREELRFAENFRLVSLRAQDECLRRIESAADMVVPALV